MRLAARHALALTSVVGLCALAAGTSGCAPGTSPGTSCTETPFISPTSATLDHTVSGNSQTFITGIKYAGSCAIPAIVPGYVWTVSDTTDASATGIGTSGSVSCKNASLTAITVYTTMQTISGAPPVATYVPDNLPTATLTCK